LFTWTCDWLQPMRFSGWRTSRNVFACLLCCTCPWTLGLTTAHAELKRVHSDAWSKGSATLSQLAADCQACKMNFYYFNAGGVCVCVCVHSRARAQHYCHNTWHIYCHFIPRYLLACYVWGRL
jgi:hypothetical protein